MKVTLRPATAADVPFLAEMLVEASSAPSTAHLPSPEAVLAHRRDGPNLRYHSQSIRSTRRPCVSTAPPAFRVWVGPTATRPWRSRSGLRGSPRPPTLRTSGG